jgi:formylglycine-generating enzyme required for sulfatase activity
MWAMVALPIGAVLCLVVGLSGGMALMSNLLGGPTAAPTQAAATGAPTQASLTQAPPPTEVAARPTDTAPPEPSPTAAAAATVPPGMVLAPAGTFQMGTAEGAADEQPVHAVTLGAFFIDTFEVTNARYQACVNDGGCTPPKQTGSFTRSNYFGNPEFNAFPVVAVTWDQAQEFCAWEGGKRLPTEAEWEYAATGGDGRRFPWGTSFDSSLVPGTASDTVPVNSFPGNASPFGALDMAGNVLEWVGDVYDAGFYAASPADNPQGPDNGGQRVMRGGSFGNADAALYTTTRRYHKAAATADEDVGFRCVLPAE